jgi:hypothetical protein
MIVDDLTKGLRNRLDEIFSIKNSMSILNIPKQNLLEKGELVILLSDKNKPVVVEFLKLGKFHLELKNTEFPKLLIEDIIQSEKIKLFDISESDGDKDYYINYGELKTEQKKDLKTFIKNTEEKIFQNHSRFDKFCSESFKKTIKIQNGAFSLWMNDNGFVIPDKKCIMEANTVAKKTNDMQLKKRANCAKCFHKIQTLKNNNSEIGE